MRWSSIFITFILISSIALAQEVESEFEIPSYVVNRSIDFRTDCYLDGNTCNVNITCSLTVYYPNGSLLYYRENMTFLNDGTYNYTIPGNTTTVLGVYESYVRCDQEVTENIRPNIAEASFRVVEKLLYDGAGFVTWQLAMILGLFGLAFFLSYLAPKMNDKMMQGGFFLGSILVAFTGLGVLVQISFIENQPAIQGMINGPFAIVLYGGVFLILIMFLKTVIRGLEELQNLLKKGVFR